MRLRPYQLDAACATLLAFETHDAALVVLPTGTGKTVVFARVAEHWTRYHSGRVLVISPMLQLIEQTRRKLKEVATGRVDVEQGARRADVRFAPAPYTVASKQTLDSRERFKRFKDIGLVVVDEAHLAATARYKAILDHYIGQGAKVLGVTATPKRGDRKAMRNIFSTVAYQMGIGEAIGDGWLCGCRTHCVTVEKLDLSAVGTAGGDFKAGELAQVMEDDRVCYEIAAVTAQESATPRPLKTVVFCASVDQARKTAEILRGSLGVAADWVCGDTGRCPPEQRAAALLRFERGDLQVIANVGVLTTGWDFPALEHIVLARPTKSLALFTQIFGRGTRPLPGLIDGEGMTADDRLAAIRGSAKPWFKFTDLRDSSKKHRLITPTDVLGGEMGLDARTLDLAADGLAAATEAIDPMAALEAAEERRKQIEEARERARERAAREAAELARRAPGAEYTAAEVDLLRRHGFANRVEVRPRRGARMMWGKHKGRLVADLPDHYLNWAVENIGQFHRLPWLASALKAEHKRRVDEFAIATAPTAGDRLERINSMLLET